MTFTDRIDFLLKQKQINASTMLADLNMGGGTLSTWKQRGTIPGGDYVTKIANYLCVSTDYLLGIEQNEKTVPKNGDGLDEVLERLRTRPECRMLFKLADGATASDVEKAAAIIEALRKVEEK